MQVRLITYTHKWYNYLIYKHEWCRCCFKGTFRKLACGINTLFYKMTANYTSYHNKAPINYFAGFPGGSVVKNLPAMQETQEMWVQSPGLRRSPGGGHGNPLQSSCLESPLDRGAWRATVHGSQRVGHDWNNCARMQVHKLFCMGVPKGWPNRNFGGTQKVMLIVPDFWHESA